MKIITHLKAAASEKASSARHKARSSKLIARSFLCSLLICITTLITAQPLNQKGNFTHQDTLRGSIGPGRDWWDAKQYSIYVQPDYNNKTIIGRNVIDFLVTKPGKDKIMQIDLQEPMKIDRINFDGKEFKKFTREGNVYWLDLNGVSFEVQKKHTVDISFSGSPRVAKNPPWDGGWIFAKDAQGRPWMSVACQGLGASVWYPCKDHQSDEPDSAILCMTVPDTLVGVGNGRMKINTDNKNGTRTYVWKVTSPINNYNIIPYIGKYVHWGDTTMSENGKSLSLDYWVLDYNLEKSKKQFGRDVKRMIHAFEYWFGPYPFYDDGYKLVESPHLGMEHQSATAYGNKYMDGYLGRDLSGSGWGLKWDYIIVHESGHEWFANNITTNDIADMWVHEGFTMYSEPLFIEYYYGKKAADEYVQGIRRNIFNDKPLIGPYGVNQEGSGDMYNKGANMLHTIRQVINDDELFREILRGLNKDFYHKTVDSKQVENYISQKSHIDFSKVFDQYLRTVKIPVLEYKITGDNLTYRWTNVVDGFNMPVKLAGSGGWLKPTTEWDNTSLTAELMNNFQVDKNFYITTKKVN